MARRLSFTALALALLVSTAAADSISWKGYTWMIKNETASGPGPHFEIIALAMRLAWLLTSA